MKDPVCGMEAGGRIKAEHKGKAYYFCNESCRKAFLKSPQKFSK